MTGPIGCAASIAVRSIGYSASEECSAIVVHTGQCVNMQPRLGRSNRYFYAPQSFADAQGRRVIFGWAQEGRSAEAQLACGWSGVMSLPRILNSLAPRA